MGEIDRRTFSTGLATAAATSLVGRAHASGRRGGTMVYTGVGNRIVRHALDVDTATLDMRDTIALPSAVQYAWPHPSRRWLYVATSDAAGGRAGSIHRLCALRLDRDGTATMHGAPQVLAQRPIHTSVDATGRWALTAYNMTPDLSVHPIARDGTLGPAVVQRTEVDHGTYPHQIRTTPSNRAVVLVTRGNDATPGRPEDPGALELYRFRDGQVSPLASIRVGGRGGLGYGPRHLDFHPTGPWVYVAVERQNRLHMHAIRGEGFSREPLFDRTTLTGQPQPGMPQAVGPIHVHPRGHVVYVGNRASGTVDHQSRPVWRGGENSIAVFAIDPRIGEPTLIQNADTHGFHPRSFAIDPTGRLLIAANMTGMAVREGDAVREIPANLALFRIAEDGRLTFVRRYDTALAPGEQQPWIAMLDRPV